jgi:hypothetical protein
MYSINLDFVAVRWLSAGLDAIHRINAELSMYQLSDTDFKVKTKPW